MEKANKQFFRAIKVICEKDMKIYYTKPPVLIFGFIFPVFLFFSFYLGKDLDIYTFFPGLLAMFLFFVASSVGPLITPWEKQAKTYERLLSFPTNINTIILGDALAGMLFGVIINIIILLAGILFFNFSISILPLLLGMVTGTFCFSSLGVLLASPSTTAPSNVMMLSSLVRFPLIFISGIFVPLEELKGAGRVISYFSPITYLVDILKFSFRQKNSNPLILNLVILFGFTGIFLFLAHKFHKRNLMRGL